MKYIYKVEIEIEAENGADAEDKYWFMKQSFINNPQFGVLDFCCSEARDENGELL